MSPALSLGTGVARLPEVARPCHAPGHGDGAECSQAEMRHEVSLDVFSRSRGKTRENKDQHQPLPEILDPCFLAILDKTRCVSVQNVKSRIARQELMDEGEAAAGVGLKLPTKR